MDIQIYAIYNTEENNLQHNWGNFLCSAKRMKQKKNMMMKKKKKEKLSCLIATLLTVGNCYFVVNVGVAIIVIPIKMALIISLS